MKYKIGDIVSVVRTYPKNPNTRPFWVSEMNKFLGQTIQIVSITDKGYYNNGNYIFREDWLEDTGPLTMEKRICNKIKELDNKWKERQLKCA